jgi:hypothetical protein
MRNRTTFVLAVGAFVAPLLVPVVIAQQQQAPAQQQPAAQQPQQATPAAPADRNSVQVGVPQGRGGAQGRQGGRGQTTGGVGGGRAAAAPIPPPRNAAGRVILGGATIKDKGVWIGGGVGRRTDADLQPWARAVVADRNANELEPHTRCKASGVSRPFMTPYGVEFVELAEMKRIYVFDIGGPHTWRTIYMDGRSHPANLDPTYYGHSIGWWEGDTLVVDSRGFNESFWLDRGNSPHTDQLHTVERFTRTDLNAIRYELTVDDPGAYTKPWTATMNLRRENGTELFEYVCQQQNFAHELMVGAGTSADRSTPIVP